MMIWRSSQNLILSFWLLAVKSPVAYSQVACNKFMLHLHIYICAAHIFKIRPHGAKIGFIWISFSTP